MLVLSSLKLGKLDEADKAAKEMVERSPADPTALNLLGMVKVAQKDYPGAEKIFTDVIKANANFSAAQRNLAAVYAITNRVDDAEKIYHQILEANASDVQALMGLGNLAVKSNNIDQAAQYFTRAQDASTQDPTPGLTLLGLYSGQKQWQKAVDLGRSLASKFPSSIPVTEALVQVQSAAGDVTGALANARHITELGPKSAVAWQEYSAAQLRSNDLPGARASLMRALALAPTDVRIKEAIVELDYRTTGVESALKTAQTFGQDDPVAGDLLSANVLQQAGRVAEATSLLQKSQQGHPDARTVIALASAQRQQGHNDEAEATLKDWISHHGSDLAAHQLLGEIYLVETQYDQAITEFETVARVQPNNIAVLNNLSIAYQHKNDPRAREVAEKAYNLAPGVPAVADTLGWIVLNGGDTAAALPYLKSAAAALSNDMDVQYHLAVALQRGGQTEEARKVLERITASTQTFENKRDAEKLLIQLQHG
jgi:putative PEP-CTERM system TPR-repeat lipoprotein